MITEDIRRGNDLPTDPYINVHFATTSLEQIFRTLNQISLVIFVSHFSLSKTNSLAPSKKIIHMSKLLHKLKKAKKNPELTCS